MGCDIHFVIERKVNDEWVGIASTDYGFNPPAKDRNYKFFGALAQVRGEGKRPPIGLPRDPSYLTKLMFNSWCSDGHSHSWMMIDDFASTWFESQDAVEIERKEYRIYDSLGIDACDDNYEPKPELYRVVFLFDN